MKSLFSRTDLTVLVRRGFYFGLLFVAIKLSSFLAPLLSSNLVDSVEEYGAFEYAITFGSIASIILDFGGNGSHPFFYFQKGIEEKNATFFFHYLPLMALMAIILFLDYCFNILSVQATLCIVITFIIGMQGRLSTIFKSASKSFYAILFDGGLFLVVNLYLAYLFLNENYFRINEILWVLELYALLLCSFFLVLFISNKESYSKELYLQILKWGVNIVVSSFLVIALTGSARIMIEFYLGLKEVGRYGFFFRLASLTVIMHQALNIYFFSKIYTGKAELLGRYLSYLLVFVLIINFLVWLVAPMVFHSFFRMLNNYSHADRILFLILSFHVFYWISMATYENLIYRENLSAKMNKFFGIILIMFISFTFFAFKLKALDTELICILNLGSLFLCTESQYQCLKAKGIRLNKLRLINIIALLVFTLVLITNFL